MREHSLQLYGHAITEVVSENTTSFPFRPFFLPCCRLVLSVLNVCLAPSLVRLPMKLSSCRHLCSLPTFHTARAPILLRVDVDSCLEMCVVRGGYPMPLLAPLPNSLLPLGLKLGGLGGLRVYWGV